MRQPLDLGPLAVAAVNLALDIDLPPGRVHFSSRAQEHASDRHPTDFELCLRHASRIIRAPDFAGRSPSQPDGFELIGRVERGTIVLLVAIKLKPDPHGRYIVASAYRLSERNLRQRIAKRTVVPI